MTTGGQQAPGRRSAGVWVLVVLLTAYRRLVSPLLPPSCRFSPSCSQYAYEAVAKHGPVKYELPKAPEVYLE